MVEESRVQILASFLFYFNPCWSVSALSTKSDLFSFSCCKVKVFCFLPFRRVPLRLECFLSAASHPLHV